jgi:hypothetical protein
LCGGIRADYDDKVTSGKAKPVNGWFRSMSGVILRLRGFAVASVFGCRVAELLGLQG